MATIKSTVDVQAWHDQGDSFGVGNGLGTTDANGLKFLTNGTQHCMITEPEGNFIVGTGVTSAPGAQKIRAFDSGNNRAFITMQNTDGTPAPANASAAFDVTVSDAATQTSSSLEGFNEFHATFPSEAHLSTDLSGGIRIRTQGTTNSPIMFDTSGTQRAVITAAGLVGINQATPGSTLTVNGSFAPESNFFTGPGTLILNDNDYSTFVNALPGAVTVRLPTPAGVNQHRVYIIKKVDASANVVNIQCPLGITLDALTTTPLTTQWQSITCQAGSPTNWYII